MRFTPLRAFVVAVTAATAVTVHSAGAQSAPDRAKLLRAAADALGMVRWSDIGAGTTRLPAIDVVNTMELQGSGTIEGTGGSAKVQYHADIGYNPPAMRVEITRPGPGGAPQRTIQTVREGYAWDESGGRSRSRARKGRRHSGDAGAS